MGWLQRRREKKAYQDRINTLTNEDKAEILIEEKTAYKETAKGLVKKRGIVNAHRDFPIPNNDLDLDNEDEYEENEAEAVERY